MARESERLSVLAAVWELVALAFRWGGEEVEGRREQLLRLKDGEGLTTFLPALHPF